MLLIVRFFPYRNVDCGVGDYSRGRKNLSLRFLLNIISICFRKNKKSRDGMRFKAVRSCGSISQGQVAISVVRGGGHETARPKRVRCR